MSENILIARSPRYQNPVFPWKEIVDFYGDRIRFIGLPNEHAEFCAQFGSVKHAPVNDFYELATWIAGCPLFIGNQSSPHAVALGLGARIISEVSLEQPDCIYRRDNVQYVADGACILPDVFGIGMDKVIPKRLQPNYDVNRAIVPPGSWQYKDLPPTVHFDVQKRLVAKLEHCSQEEADEKLVRTNVSRCPDFFRHSSNDRINLFLLAYQYAFDIDQKTKSEQTPTLDIK